MRWCIYFVWMQRKNSVPPHRTSRIPRWELTAVWMCCSRCRHHAAACISSVYLMECWQWGIISWTAITIGLHFRLRIFCSMHLNVNSVLNVRECVDISLHLTSDTGRVLFDCSKKVVGKSQNYPGKKTRRKNTFGRYRSIVRERWKLTGCMSRSCHGKTAAEKRQHKKYFLLWNVY